MIKFTKIVLLLLLFCISAVGQQKISVEGIYSGVFRTKGMDELQSMKNSNQYTVLNYDAADRNFSIDLYNFSNLEKADQIISSGNFEALRSIDSYIFSNDEKQLLLATNTTSIYRHSFTAKYYLYDRASKNLTAVADFGIQEPRFSPDGKQIAYAKDNNLYIYTIASKKTIQITYDGAKNSIINGISDWVYEEEFAFVRAFDWSADSKKIAYIKFDETLVPEFSMNIFESNLYPTNQTFKYPKPGENNSVVSLQLYSLENNKTSTVDLSNYTDFYIARIGWTKDANVLSAQVLNRHQNNLDLLFVNGNTGKTTVVLNEKNNTYVDVTDNLSFLDNNSFVWTSEKDGYNHVYLYDKNGKLLNQVTKGLWEVTNLYGIDAKNQKAYFQSTEDGSINRSVYSIDLNGKNKKKLSLKVGTNAATFSPNYQYFINSYSSSTQATTYTLNASANGKELKMIENNAALSRKVADYNVPNKEFFVLTTEKGHNLNAWILKPKDFDPSKKYPLFMFQYSGPGSQQVANQWNSTNDYWFSMLTQQGYIVACVDGRGTGYKGADFKKVTQLQLGKYEVEDQIDAAKVLGSYTYIDASRVGIFGWSYGGFMSANCLLKGNDVFKMAISVAPVTNWRFYDSIYTERYMHTPQENPLGYDDNSPINHVEKLQGKLLLIHGSADDNVHVQNSMEMMEALIQANKQFDSQIYPDKNHGIYGGKTRIQLYNKMTTYIKDNL